MFEGKNSFFLLFATGILPTFMTFVGNFFNIFHAAFYCVLKAFDQKLKETCTDLETFASSDRKIVRDLLKLEDFFLVIAKFASDFKKISSELVSLTFANSLMNFLVQLVFMFMFFALGLKINKDNFIYISMSTIMAFSEFFNLLTIITCVDQVNKMVKVKAKTGFFLNFKLILDNHNPTNCLMNMFESSQRGNTEIGRSN